MWADGEHWSACWQVAYSLLSELALSHMQWDTHTKTHTYAHTQQQLWALIGTQKGLMERGRETGMKEEMNIKNADQLVKYLPPKHWRKECTFKDEFYWMKNGQNQINEVSKHVNCLWSTVLVSAPEILRQHQQQKPFCWRQLSWYHRMSAGLSTFFLNFLL